MKLVTSWAKEWLRRTILEDHEVVSALERAGLEVEQFHDSKPIDQRVVVGLVKSVVQHPAADRLKLVEVVVGSQSFRVVCGAPNVRVGLKVAFAQIGTTLPDGETISRAKLRGEVSEGMLCSQRELGLGSDHEGILELAEGVSEGTLVAELFPAEGVVDLKTPANRFDVLSVIGLVREIAAMTKAELKQPDFPAIHSKAEGPAVKAGAKAGRYMLAELTINPDLVTPGWMVNRLRAAGVRSISLVVDLTNYVMLETGQPLHAFDAAKVQLPIVVRAARDGERLVTLDGVERKLVAEDIVIADATGPIALAGVMGGASTEIGHETTQILLESAVFEGVAVRKTAQRHGLRTEASARFERSLPVELPAWGLSRAVQLLTELAGGQVGGVTDQQSTKPHSHRIAVPLDHLSKLLGISLKSSEAESALGKLGIEARAESKAGVPTVVVPEVPWWRPDLTLGEDLVEEIVRVIGYERIPSTIPAWRPAAVRFDRLRGRQRQLRDLLFAAGLFEVMTYSFVSAEQLDGLGWERDQHLKLKNPLSVEQAYLRSSLLPSHLAVLERNQTYAPTIGFYELSRVFRRRDAGEQPLEPFMLAVTISQPKHAYARLKGVLDAVGWHLNVELTTEPAQRPVFAPGRGAKIKLGTLTIGYMGQVHPEHLSSLKRNPEVAFLELDAQAVLAAAGPRQFAGLSRFPSMARDLTVLVPKDVTWQVVTQTLAGQPVEFVTDYYGPELPTGFKSLTLRLTLMHPERTPTEAEATDLESAVLARLVRKLGAKPQG